LARAGMALRRLQWRQRLQWHPPRQAARAARACPHAVGRRYAEIAKPMPKKSAMPESKARRIFKACGDCIYTYG